MLWCVGIWYVGCPVLTQARVKKSSLCPCQLLDSWTCATGVWCSINLFVYWICWKFHRCDFVLSFKLWTHVNWFVWNDTEIHQETATIQNAINNKVRFLSSYFIRAIVKVDCCDVNVLYIQYTVYSMSWRNVYFCLLNRELWFCWRVYILTDNAS